MKKELQTQFEALVRERMSEFYAKAYMVAGNREEAESLTEDALVWAEGKFKGLANKARVIDLISERIGKGEHGGFETADEDAIFMRAMARVRSKGNIRKLIGGVCGIVMTAVVLAFAIPQIPFDALIPTEATTTATETDSEGKVILPVIGEVKMDKTQTVKGDNGVITLENYHNISKNIGIKTVLEDGMSDGGKKIDRYIATVTAPDGTAYAAFTDIIITTESANNKFTLYRMEKDGWKAVGEGESASSYRLSSYLESYDSSNIYMEADDESNIYVFVLLDGCVVVYRYDRKTGEFTKSEAALPCMGPMMYYTFSVDYDPTVGEKGAICVGYTEKYKIGFAYYDIAEDTFVNIVEPLGKSDELKRFFRVKDGVIHLISQGNGVVNRYYRIEADGTISKILTLGSDGDRIWVFNAGSGCGGLVVDENGVCHILATVYERDYSYILRYKISPDGTMTQERLPKLYYQNSPDHKSMCIGVFSDDSGNIYYAELYHSYGVADNVCAIGKLSENIGEAPVCMDVLEIPNNITFDFGRNIQNSTVVFFSKDDIFYFTVKGLGE